MQQGSITPEGHQGFLAKKLFDEMGKIQWGAIAYIEKGGGGPANDHTHGDDHLFLIADGRVRIVSGDREMFAGKDEAVFVEGMVPHSIWNAGEETAVVIKIATAQASGGEGSR